MAWSAPSLLNDATGTTAATSQTMGGITASAGTLVVVALAFIASNSSVTGVTIADSAGGNSWNIHYVEQTSVPGYLGFAWSVLSNGFAGGSITITRSGSGNIKQWAMAAYALSGENASAPEDTAVYAGSTGASTSPVVAGNAAGRAGDFVFALDAEWPSIATTYTEDATDGWTNLLNNLKPSNTSVGLSVAYQTNSGTSGLTHAPHLSASVPWAEMQVGLAPTVTTLSIGAAGAMMARGASAASLAATIAARSASKSRGSSAGSYATSVGGHSTICAVGKAGGVFRTSVSGRALLALSGAGAPGFFVRAAGRLLAALKAFARPRDTAVTFDPDYALLAPSRAETLVAPGRSDALLASSVIEAFLAE
jgi:hypothetical protein